MILKPFPIYHTYTLTTDSLSNITVWADTLPGHIENMEIDTNDEQTVFIVKAKVKVIKEGSHVSDGVHIYSRNL